MVGRVLMVGNVFTVGRVPMVGSIPMVGSVLMVSRVLTVGEVFTSSWSVSSPWLVVSSVFRASLPPWAQPTYCTSPNPHLSPSSSPVLAKLHLRAFHRAETHPHPTVGRTDCPGLHQSTSGLGFFSFSLQHFVLGVLSSKNEGNVGSGQRGMAGVGVSGVEGV